MKSFIYGVCVMLFVGAGLYKAAFLSLPDLTILFFALTLIWSIGHILRSGKVEEPVLKSLLFLIFLTVFTLISTIFNVKWPGFDTKLIRFIIINGWAFLGGAILAASLPALRGFIVTQILLAISFTISNLNNNPLTALSSLKDATNYLGVARITAMGALVLMPLLTGNLKKWQRILALIGVLFLTFGTFSSGGRGPTVGLLVVILVYFFVTITAQSSMKKKILTLLVFLLILSFLGFLFYGGFFDKFLMRLSSIEGDQSFLGRVDRLIQGLDFWFKAPLLGNGPNAFPDYYGNGNLNETPHNLVVEIGAEFGLFTLLIISAFYLYIVIELLKILFGRYKINDLYQPYFISVLLVLVFWLGQVPLIGIATGKFAAVYLGIGLTLLKNKEINDTSG